MSKSPKALRVIQFSPSAQMHLHNREDAQSGTTSRRTKPSRWTRWRPATPTSLSISVLIGKLVGCVPQLQNKKKPCHRLPALAYVTLTFLVNIAALLNFTFRIIPATFSPTVKVSEGIVLTATVIVLSCSEVVKRLYFMSRHQLVFEILEKVRALKERVLSIARGFSKSSNRPLNKYGVWAFWSLMLASMALQIVGSSGKDRFDDTIATLLLLTWKATGAFSTALLVGLGDKLLACYDGFAAEFLDGFGSGDRSSDDTKDLASIFEEMKECFALYGKIVGFLALISVLESSILSPLSVYMAVYYAGVNNSYTTSEMLVAGVLYALRVVLIAGLGQAVGDSVSPPALMLGCSSKLKCIVADDQDERADSLEDAVAGNESGNENQIHRVDPGQTPPRLELATECMRPV